MVGPPAPSVGTTFKETSIAAEKELDASVLWRAVQSVNSAISAFKEQQARSRAAEIAFEGAIRELNGGIAEEAVIGKMADLVSYREYYHPIIVTNALLWACGYGRSPGGVAAART